MLAWVDTESTDSFNITAMKRHNCVVAIHFKAKAKNLVDQISYYPNFSQLIFEQYQWALNFPFV